MRIYMHSGGHILGIFLKIMNQIKHNKSGLYFILV
jgi:hypothetical protein